MNNFKTIKNLYNVLPPHLLQETYKQLNQSKWGLNKSYGDSNKIFWGINFTESTLFNETILSIIENITGDKFKINKILGNAQSTLQDGFPHADSSSVNARTFILYPNEQWDYLWGGQIIFFDRYLDSNDREVVNSNDVYNIYPIPNSAVYFPSNIIHYGTAPTRDFHGVRFSIAWHLEII